LANELSMRRGLLKWNHSCGACDLIRTLGQVVSEIVGSSHEKHFVDEGAFLLKLETLPSLKLYLDRDMHLMGQQVSSPNHGSRCMTQLPSWSESIFSAMDFTICKATAHC
jgi:hypothetical protein